MFGNWEEVEALLKNENYLNLLLDLNWFDLKMFGFEQKIQIHLNDHFHCHHLDQSIDYYFDNLWMYNFLNFESFLDYHNNFADIADMLDIADYFADSEEFFLLYHFQIINFYLQFQYLFLAVLIKYFYQVIYFDHFLNHHEFLLFVLYENLNHFALFQIFLWFYILK